MPQAGACVDATHVYDAATPTAAAPMTASDPLHRRQALGALAIAVTVTLALYWIPLLRLLSWPLLLLSTLVHELGHGLGALLVGGRFEALLLWPDGSGVAAYAGHFGAFGLAAVAAAGLLGPPMAALALFVAGRRSHSAHVALGVFGALLGLVVLLWAGSLFTALFCLSLAALLGLLAWRASPAVSQVVCVFLAVQLALASFSRSDYLFTPIAQTAQGPMPSDVARIAELLWLPYWVWGGLIAGLSLGLLLLGGWWFARALKSDSRLSRPPPPTVRRRPG
jgi:hypothetical protein